MILSSKTIDHDSDDLKELVRLLAAGADINTANPRGLTCLMYTVRNYQATELLLDNKADINKKDHNGWTAIHHAFTAGYMQVVRLLLLSGADPDIKDNFEVFPLSAKLFDDKRMEKLLKEKGASLLNGNERQKLKKKLINHSLLLACDPVSEAAEVDHEELQRLLAAGADINTRDSDGWTCLMMTAVRGSYRAVKLLIEKNADINMKDNQNSTALNIASNEGHIEIVRLLLDSGADPDIKDDYGETPLFSASSNGFTEIEDILLEYGASPLKDDGLKWKQEKLNNELVTVCENENKVEEFDLKELQRLLAAGADINYRDRASNPTCLMKMAMDGRVKATQLLLDYKADVNMKDSNGGTALHHASAVGNTEVVQMLLEYGANPDIKDNDGESPLFVASSNGEKEVENLLLKDGASSLDEKEKLKITNDKLLRVCWPLYPTLQPVDLRELQRLLEAGAEVNRRSDRAGNETCLMRMAMEKELKATELLLDYKADANTRDSEGLTALHYGSSLGYIEIVRLLLDYGADPDIKDNDGRTALQRTRNKKIEKFLLAAGATTDDYDDDDDDHDDDDDE